MGSIGGAFLATLVIAEIKAFCIGIGEVSVLGFDLSFSKLTLVVDFLVMAGVLVARPWGLLGQTKAPQRGAGTVAPLMPPRTGNVSPDLPAAAAVQAAKPSAPHTYPRDP